jgi:hypothetical protein
MPGGSPLGEGDDRALIVGAVGLGWAALETEERAVYEHHKEPVLPREQFLRRVTRHGGASVLIIVLSLGIGTAGYHVFAGLGWIDALLNASMILTGMGPVAMLTTDAAKLFASFYALYSGIVFLAATGVFFAPFLHRVLHTLHASD